jgi:feruloyl esterase
MLSRKMPGARKLFGLGKTTADLARYRRQWQTLMKTASELDAGGFTTGASGGAKAARLSSKSSAKSSPRPSARSRRAGDRLVETPSFSPNPGKLRMFAYAPANLKPGAPLVVVLHGCTQDALGYDRGSGWSALADREGFAVLFPEQQQGNNAKTCFSWFQKPDIKRGSGEARSIKAMVDVMLASHALDPERVYITGLSAGGAMAGVMLAAYPETFRAGALIGGLPYGAATSVPEAFQAMFSGQQREPGEWGDLVRAAAPKPERWPAVSVWHGSSDTTVKPLNGAETVKQWLDVHGLVDAPSIEEDDGPVRRRLWLGGDGRPRVEEVIIDGMGHGTPVAAAALGEEGAFFLEVGVSSTEVIAAGWGLTSATAGKPAAKPAAPEIVVEPEPQPAEAAEWADKARRSAKADKPAEKPEETPEPAFAGVPEGVANTIHAALRAAGLMK